MRLQPSARSRVALLFAFALLTALPLHAQDIESPRTRTFPGVESAAFPYAQPEEVGLSSAKLNRLADEVAHWVAGGEIVGAELLIIKNRRIVLHEAFGWSDREQQRPMERNSLFSITSMSKPFTAAAILILEQDGKLSLTDRVGRYVPAYPSDSATIRHLLTHTSGFPDRDTGNVASLKEWVEGAAAAVPTRPLGEFGYNSFNYGVLGYVVEAISGVPVETFIEERILRPLGLDDTHTTFSTDAPWASRMNSWYYWDGEAGAYERYWSHEDDQRWQFYPAGFGLYSTAMDYAEFLAMWMDKGRYGGTRLLTEENVKEALRPHAPFADRSYGYGWWVRTAPREAEMPGVFDHGGVSGTWASAFTAVDAMVIFLTQSRDQYEHSNQTRWREYRQALMNRLGMLEIFDHPGPYARGMVWAGNQDAAKVDLSPIEQARYVGAYRDPGGEDAPERVVRVWQESGRLHYRLGELGRRADRGLHLVPLGDHRFTPGRYRGDQLETIDAGSRRFRFVIGDGQVTGVEVLEGDQVRVSAQRTGPDTRITDLDAKIPDAGEALIEAAGDGDSATVRALLERGADVHATDTRGRTALHHAAGRNHASVVRTLLEGGADLNHPGLGRTALHYAADRGHTSVVRALLEGGADVNAREQVARMAQTALHRAAIRGHTSVVRALLEGGADVNATDQVVARTALHWAAIGGHTSVVRALFDASAPVDLQDAHGKTALMWASLFGQSSVAHALLEAGADVNAADNTGRTSLMAAAMYGQEVMVRELLAAGADVSRRDDFGSTALDQAKTFNRPEVIRVLEEARDAIRGSGVGDKKN